MSKKKFITLFESIAQIKNAESNAGVFKKSTLNDDSLQPISERIKLILTMNKKARTILPGQVYFLVFYDIENNKVRNRIAKYLLKKGCERIQKSVYMALLNRKLFREMQQTLSEIQAMYDNDDSIIFLPVATDQVDSMKLIGQNLNIALTFENKSTIFI